MEITNQIIGQLKEHFAKKWNVTSDKVHLGRGDISIKGEEFYLNIPITRISVGPDRLQTIMR